MVYSSTGKEAVMQEVKIYTTGWTTATSQFNKDLKRMQAQGFKLVSVTPTRTMAGTTTQLTAIYERG